MAVRTVSNAGGNWNVTTTWVGGVVPSTTLDTVVFTATSGQLIVNVASTCIGIDFTNYINTITFTALLTINGPVNLGTGGYTQAGASGITAGATATHTSGGVTWSRLWAFAGLSQTHTLSGIWNFTGTLNFSGTTPMILNGSTIKTANLTVANSNTVSGTTNIVFNGTGTWIYTIAGVIRNNITINTAGILTISGTINYGIGTLTYTAGTVTTTGSTLNITTSSTLNTSGIIWNNVTLAGTQILTSGLNMGGNLTTQSTDVVLSGVVNVNVGGNLSINITTSGTATIILNGTGAQTWSSTGFFLSNDTTIHKASGTLTISANVYYSTGTLLYTAGTVNTTTNNSTLNISTSTLSTGTLSWNNIKVLAAATITLGANLKLSKQFTLNGGGYTLTITPGIYSVDFSTADVTIGTTNFGAISFIYNGTINCVNFRVLAGNGSATTLNGSTYNITGNFTIDTPGTGGSVTGTSTINLTGTGTVQQLNSGIYAVPLTNNFTINTSGTITFLSGTRFFYQTGIFTYTAGTVITTNVIFGILGSCTLNTNQGATQIDWTNVTSFATATITLSSNLNITNLTVSSGTLSFALGVNNLLISGNLTISGTFNTPQNLQVVNLILGNATINGLFTISASGNLTQSNSVTINSTTTIQLNGTGTWSNASVGALTTNLIINTTGVVTISGNVYYNSGTLTYNTGTVNVTGSTLFIGASPTISTPGLTWNNVTFATIGNYAFTITSDLLVGGTFTIGGGGTINGLFNIYCGALAVNNSTSGAGSVPVVLSGVIYCSGNCTISGVTGSISIACIVYVGGSLFFNAPATNYQGGTGFVMTGTGVLSQLSNSYPILGNITFNKSSNITITTDLYFYVSVAVNITNLGGKINATKSTLYIGGLSITSTLIGMNTINWKAVQIASGSTLLMNEFFSGSPGVTTTITPSSTTNYTITFQDRFEKFSKFVKVSRATLSNPGQLTVTTNKGNQLNNVGIKFASNQIANGLTKNTPSINNINPNGLSPTYLVTDPTLS